MTGIPYFHLVVKLCQSYIHCFPHKARLFKLGYRHNIPIVGIILSLTKAVTKMQ